MTRAASRAPDGGGGDTAAESWAPSCTGSRTSPPSVHSRAGQWNLWGASQAGAGVVGRRAPGEPSELYSSSATPSHYLCT